MHTCTFFATYTNWLSRELEKIDPDLTGSEKPSNMNKQEWQRYQADRVRRGTDSTTSASGSSGGDPARFEKMNENMKKYEENFSKNLRILLDALNHYAATETVVLLGLCARLSTANQGTQYSGMRTEEDAATQARE